MEDIDVPFDFAISEPYITKGLSLGGNGHKEVNDWSEDKQQFKDILQAIANSGLKDSLEWLHIIECEMTTEEAQTYLNEAGLNHIEATDTHEKYIEK